MSEQPVHLLSGASILLLKEGLTSSSSAFPSKVTELNTENLCISWYENDASVKCQTCIHRRLSLFLLLFAQIKGPLAKGMATHSSIIAWRTPWTEELGGLQSMKLHRVRHTYNKELVCSLLLTRSPLLCGCLSSLPVGLMPSRELRPSCPSHFSSSVLSAVVVCPAFRSHSTHFSIHQPSCPLPILPSVILPSISPSFQYPSTSPAITFCWAHLKIKSL